MQIHELTTLTEAGIIDYIKAAVNKDPNLAGMSVSQRAQALQNNQVIKQLGEVLTQQWLAKAAILQKQAAAQPQQFQAQTPTQAGQPNNRVQIAPDVYKKYLLDFVNKTVFRNQMRYLDASSRAQVDKNINDIVASKDTPQALLPLFQDLAQTASITMMSSMGSQSSTATPAAGQPAGPGTPAAKTNTQSATAKVPSAASVKRDLESIGARFPGRDALQQTIEQLHGESRVSKTDNAYANALLQLLGFTVQ